MPFSSESANLSVTQPITPRTQISQSPQIRHPFQTKATTFQVPKLTLEQTENSQTKQKRANCWITLNKKNLHVNWSDEEENQSPLLF